MRPDIPNMHVNWCKTQLHHHHVFSCSGIQDSRTLWSPMLLQLHPPVPTLQPQPQLQLQQLPLNLHLLPSLMAQLLKAKLPHRPHQLLATILHQRRSTTVNLLPQGELSLTV